MVVKAHVEGLFDTDACSTVVLAVLQVKS